jgi:hypothetical protein
VGDDLPDMCNKMNEDLGKIIKFCEANKLKVHQDKFQSILITTSKQKKNNLLLKHPDCKIIVGNQIVPFQDTMKYLGVQVDYLLNFHAHIEYVTKKIAKKTGYLGRISKYLSQWTRKTIFNTIISPHFSYCSTLLLDLPCKDMAILQKLQSKNMRLILQCNARTHRKDMAKTLQWMSVKQNIVFRVILFIRDILESEPNNTLNTYIVKNNNIHGYATRRANDFHMHTQKNTTGQKSLFVNGLKLFNSLPDHMKVPNLNRNLFKIRLMEHVKKTVSFL